MLARVSGGKSGIVEYLVGGIKNGRDFTRDELDQRVCIDGNLDLTDAFINAISTEESDNYFHITLSFKEKDITAEEVTEAYNDYKEKLMSAYSKDEYNCYAEIHFPKIQALEDKKTGEMHDRFPHVHMVIPKKNLLTNGDLSPFGKYTKVEDYHDSIQESVNRKFNLSSPYDNPREMKSNADLISRYKGDNFKPAVKELKSDILDRVNDSEIKTWEEFKDIVAEYGEVKETNSKKDGKYLSVKLPDAKKNIRLKDSCFSEMYIQKREYKDPKPSDKVINGKVEDWVNKISHEVKHISKANPEFRKEYYAASEEDQQLILKDRIEKYDRRYDIRTGRSESNKQLGFKRSQGSTIGTYTEIKNGLPSMFKRDVVNGSGREGDRVKSILPNNERDNLDDKRKREHNQLRWSGDKQRGGRISLATQLLKDYKENSSKENELELFRDIKLNLQPKHLFKELNKYNVQQSDFKSFKTKNGYRIKAGTTNLNVSDFLTKHLHLDWDEAKEILVDAYQNQSEINLTQDEGNYIIFKPEIGLKNEYTVWDSIHVFNYLKRLEAQEAYDMKGIKKLQELLDNSNEIQAKNKPLSFTEQYQQQQQSDKAFNLDDLVATKNLKKNEVTYKNAETGKPEFIDRGDRIRFPDKEPSDSTVLAGIKMAAEKYGTVKLKGTDEFKQSVLEQAAKNDIKVVFLPKELHEQFNQVKQDLANENTITNAKGQENEQEQKQDNKQDVKQEPIKQENTPEDKQPLQQAEQPLSTEAVSDNQEPVNMNEGEIVSFGAAKYQNKKENKISYQVTLKLANGDNHTLWGVGLRDAIQDNNIKLGDKAEFEHKGVQPVEITKDILDADKNVIDQEQATVSKNIWEATVKEVAEIKEPEIKAEAIKPEIKPEANTVTQEPVKQEPEQQGNEQQQQGNQGQHLDTSAAKAQHDADMFNAQMNSAGSEQEVNAAMDEYFNQANYADYSFPDEDYSQSNEYQPEQQQQQQQQTVEPSQQAATAVISNIALEKLIDQAIQLMNQARKDPNDFDSELVEADALTLADKVGNESFKLGISDNPFADSSLADQFDSGYANAKIQATNAPDLQDLGYTKQYTEQMQQEQQWQEPKQEQAAPIDNTASVKVEEQATLEKGFYRIMFKWNAEESSFEPRINGMPLSDVVTPEFVDKLRTQDKFLENFNKEEIMSGNLKAENVTNGESPKGFTINELGDKTSAAQNSKAKSDNESLSM